MSTVFTVQNASELQDALISATGGDRIELLPGAYGDVTLRDYNFSSEVTIASADPTQQAELRSLALVNVSNISVDNIFVDFTPDENTVEWSSAIRIENSNQVSISNSTVLGGDSIVGVPEDSNPGEQGAQGILGWPTGRGITVTSSTEITIENNDVSEFHRGIVLINVDGVDILANEVHNVRASTLVGGGISNVTVDANYFHSSQPWNYGGLGDHGDYIFFWTNAGQTAPNENIVITNNILEQGDGTSLLGIMFQDQSGIGTGTTGVLIEGNTIYNGHNLGIILDAVDDVEVRDNTLLLSSGEANMAPGIWITETATNVLTNNNISAGISGPGVGLEAVNNNILTGNLSVDYENTNSANYFDRLFYTSYNSADIAENIRAVLGRAADGYGSSLIQLDTTPAEVTPVFLVSSVAGGVGGSFIFDATDTNGPLGQITDQNATFIWDFGDGTTETGQVVQHVFNAAGYFEVNLQVVLNDGTTATASGMVGAAGSDILAFNSSDGMFHVQGYGADTALAQTDDASVDIGGGGMAVDLGGSGAQVTISRNSIAQFFETETFDISMTLQADQPGTSWGEIVRLHTSFTVSVTESGELKVDLFPDTGELVTLITSGVVINDGLPHDINIRFDGAIDRLQILVDGNVAATAPVAGAMPSMGSGNLFFGNPWGGQNFDGKLTAFDLNADSNEYPIFDGVLSDPKDPVETQPDPLPQPGPLPEPDPAPAEDPVDTDPKVPDAPAPMPEPEPTSLPVLDDVILNIDVLDETMLRGDAVVIDTAAGPAVSMDGRKDYVDLGFLTQFDGADRTAMVAVDAVSDRLQVVIDDEVMYDQTVGNLDAFDGDDVSMHRVLGSLKRDGLDGQISDFRIEQDTDFVEDVLVLDDASLVA